MGMLAPFRSTPQNTRRGRHSWGRAGLKLCPPPQKMRTVTLIKYSDWSSWCMIISPFKVYASGQILRHFTICAMNFYFEVNFNYLLVTFPLLSYASSFKISISFDFLSQKNSNSFITLAGILIFAYPK